jgi:hypothetical protein
MLKSIPFISMKTFSSLLPVVVVGRADGGLSKSKQLKGRGRIAFGCAIAMVGLGSWGLEAAPSYGPPENLEAILRWNQVAIDASGLDHMAPAPGENRVFREQLGPGRASRAIAIVHLAIFDAVNAVRGGYESYSGLTVSPGPVALPAAIAQAGHDTLIAMFPAQTAIFDAQLGVDLREVRNRNARANGVTLGQRAAAAVLLMRSEDGASHPEPFLGTDWTTSDLAGHWRMDPISRLPIVLGGHWGECIPFVLESSSQFRAPPPPPMESEEYAVAFDEVKRLGGDGTHTPTERTPEQTFIGIYWAYDGTPSLCAPPRLYNQIAVQIAHQMKSDDVATARLLALVNVAMADAGMAIWESKYFYDFWRPVTGVREADPGTGPTGSGDGNPATVGDPNWTPLGAPASNVSGGLDFTPPFPAYPSGHAGFGGALFQTLRGFYGTDEIPFTFVSDELNGVTRDAGGNVRPLVPRSFANLSQAEEENGQSRIYLGIHWKFDKTASIALGRQVADYVLAHTLRPLPPRVR